LPAALSPIHASFGQALRELRAERGLSQEAVALAAGLNRGYYSGVERGVRNVAWRPQRGARQHRQDRGCSRRDGV
jgi:transcriptional regulator with XRE-family HTH domain